MSKVSITALSSGREELVELLHGIGVVQITDAAAAAAEREEFAGLFDVYQPSTRELRLAIARCEFLIELLERFEEKKGGLVAGMLARRVHLDYREFMSAEEEVDLESLYRELEGSDVELKRLKARVAEVEKELEYLDALEVAGLPFRAVRTELETVVPRTVDRRPRTAACLGPRDGDRLPLLRLGGGPPRRGALLPAGPGAPGQPGGIRSTGPAVLPGAGPPHPSQRNRAREDALPRGGDPRLQRRPGGPRGRASGRP